MIVSTLLFAIYLVRWRPFVSRLDHFLNILSIIILIILYCFCLIFAVLQPSSHQYSRSIIGYLFISLVLLLFLFTCILIVTSKIIECVRKSKKAKALKTAPIETTLSTMTELKPNYNRSGSLFPRMSLKHGASHNPPVEQNLHNISDYQEEPSFLEERAPPPPREFGVHLW